MVEDLRRELERRDVQLGHRIEFDEKRAGEVPSPGKGDEDRVLHADRTWRVPASSQSTSGTNIGSGIGVHASASNGEMTFRSLSGTGGIVVDLSGSTVLLSGSAGSAGLTSISGTNIGTGIGIHASASAGVMTFRSLTGSGVGVALSGSTLVLSATVDLTTIGNFLLSTGEDGALNFDGSSVVVGVTPSFNANWPGYTTIYSITRDLHPTTVTVASGVLVLMGTNRLFATDSITLNGDIGHPGIAGGNATAVAGGTGGAGGGAGVLYSRNAGGGGGAAAGGNSATAPADFLAGTNTGGTSPGATAGQNGSGLGRGGGGGGSNGGTSTGNSGGTVTNSAASEGSISNLLQALTLRQVATVSNRYSAGGGGGGGANGGGVKFGGGGGSSAANVVVCAKSFSGSGALKANGGPGGLGNGGGGSGGGGAGGILVCVICTGNFPTCDVSGGAGGASNAGGGAGGNGAAGVVKQFRIGS